MIYHEKDNTFYNGVYRSKSGEFIIIYHSNTLVNDYQILNANDPDGRFKNFTARGTEHEYSIEHYQDKFFIITNWEAKNNRLMETSENATESPVGTKQELLESNLIGCFIKAIKSIPEAPNVL